MFEHSLAKVLEDPTDNNLPHYDEALIKKNTSLSPHGRNVIHPLLVRKNGATYSERTADGKIIKRVINPNEVSLRSTQGGENLLPEKLQDLFTLRLADSNALQRLGMEVDQNLEGTVAFTVQSGVPTAAFRDNSNRTQAFQANPGELAQPRGAERKWPDRIEVSPLDHPCRSNHQRKTFAIHEAPVCPD